MDEPKFQIESFNFNEQLLESQAEFVVPSKQSLALATLGTCLLLGVLGAVLFKNQFWELNLAQFSQFREKIAQFSQFLGLNIALFGLLLIGSLLILKKLGRQRLGYAQYALAASSLFFAGTFAWRDSLVLNSLSLLGILLTIILAFSLGTRNKLKKLNVFEAFQDLYRSSRYGIVSYYELINRDIQWDDVKKRWGQTVRATIRGVIIAIPLVLVFGFLLTTSDTRFEGVVHYLLDWELEAKTVVQYLLTFILCGWIAAAVLRGSVLNTGLTSQVGLVLPAWHIGCVEIGIILGAINLLFLSFIVVQFTYFFGGDALVQSSEGLTYAKYARHGFYQLVTVAFLVITLLLSTHWLYKPYSLFEIGLYYSLAMLMVVMTMIIEASAAYRMYLYTHDYGLTELRFYTSVFMVWLVVLFILFSFTVLRGKRSRFTFGAILTTMVFIGLLHFFNPDAQIAEVNLSRLQAGQQFDADYVASLSADVVPTLLTALPKLPNSPRCELWKRLQDHRVLQTVEDWRNWRWARSQAREFFSPVETSKQCNSLSIKD